ncbi:MAG: hypothetical protein ACKO5E_07560 [bacterium]
MNHSLSPWVAYSLLVASGLTGGLGDIWIYNWAKSGKPHWLFLAGFVWLASLFLFGLLLKWDSRTFSAAFMLCTVMHVVLVIICDILYFGGRLNRLEWAGMVVAAIAVVMLEIGRESASADLEDSSGVSIQITNHESK